MIAPTETLAFHRPWPVVALTGLLAIAATTYLGYHLIIALGPDDTNHLETPLALALAGQVREGFGSLYGPFSGARPRVLIHAPLYYRIAGLGAWPLVALGVDPVDAAFATGRALSLLATIALLVAAARIGGMRDDRSRGSRRLDDPPPTHQGGGSQNRALPPGGGGLGGGSAVSRTQPRLTNRAAIWTILLIASAPVLGSFPVTVRPDTLGLALQTAGAALVLGEFARGESRRNRLIAAYVTFGLAASVKQHDVVATLISSALLALTWLRGRARLGPIAAAHAVGLAVVVGYYAIEQGITGGWMFESVFRIPRDLGRVERADWSHVGTVFLEAAKMSIGLLALAVAVLVASRRRCEGGGGSRIDATLLAYLAAELAAMVALCLNSAGAWTNYAMQAVVFGSILVARGAARALGRPRSVRVGISLVAAALALVLADARLVAISARARFEDRMALAAFFADPDFGSRPRETVYFPGAPQHNRRFGRARLAHDEWLYTAYETLGAAEPRSAWLHSALADGPVRLVVAAEPGEAITQPGGPRPGRTADGPRLSAGRPVRPLRRLGASRSTGTTGPCRSPTIPRTRRARGPIATPEFRSSGRPAPRGPNVLSAEHQRIVANPFLAAAGLLLWLAGLSWVNRASGFGGAGFVFVMLWALAPIRYLPRLIHYHCRDCGATGRLATWKAHACPTVIGRQRSREPPTITGAIAADAGRDLGLRRPGPGHRLERLRRADETRLVAPLPVGLK